MCRYGYFTKRRKTNENRHKRAREWNECRKSKLSLYSQKRSSEFKRFARMILENVVWWNCKSGPYTFKVGNFSPSWYYLEEKDKVNLWESHYYIRNPLITLVELGKINPHSFIILTFGTCLILKPKFEIQISISPNLVQSYLQSPSCNIKPKPKSWSKPEPTLRSTNTYTQVKHGNKILPKKSFPPPKLPKPSFTWTLITPPVKLTTIKGNCVKSKGF